MVQRNLTPPAVKQDINIITYADFEARFTEQEWDDATDYEDSAAPIAKRKLKQSLRRAVARNWVDLTHQGTINCLEILVQGSIITDERRNEILIP